jgi:formate dehydrogenase subunit gamma
MSTPSPASPKPASASRLPPAPASFTPAPTAREAQALERALAEHGVHQPDTPAAQATALLPVLHHIQDALGWVPPALVPPLAQAFNRSRAEVHGVLTYYHHFRRQAPAPHVVQLCQAEACRALGAVGLMQQAQALFKAPSPLRPVAAPLTLEPAFCLGLCAQAPAALLNGQPRARLSLPALHAWAQAQGWMPAEGHCAAGEGT